MSERVVLLQHEPAGTPGSLGDWVRARGFEIELLMAGNEWSMPDLDSVAFVASLGSRYASYDDSLPWLARELDVLRRAHDQDVPVLGICFGSQSLARALGARTQLAEVREIGWIEMDSGSPDLVPPGPWLFWHEDRFDVPADAQLLATTPMGPAAFRAGRSLGLQFHPEAEPDSVEEWIEILDDQLSPAQGEDLRRGFADPELVRARAWRLYDSFLENIARKARP